MKKVDRPLVVGITGAFGSGKSTAAEFLKNFGFTKISLVQFLEEELTRRNDQKITRNLLQDLGNNWREKYGACVLSEKARELIKGNRIEKAVVEGFRNVSEVEEFRKQENFKLIGIVVNRKIRFDRLKMLDRREKLDWDLFNKLDNRDLGIGEKESGLQVAFCLAMADIFIENNASKEIFFMKLEKALSLK